MKKILAPLLLVFISSGIIMAQSSLRPSKQYSSGDVLYGAKSGAKSIVPNGWSGMLPRDSEVFLLLPEDGSNAEIYITSSKFISIEQRKSDWLVGFELGNGNVLKSDGKIFMRGKSLASNIILQQATSNTKGYIEMLCGPFGDCITATLFSSPQDFEKVKKSLIEFMDGLTWLEPNLEADYADLNWHEFLSGKHLLNYDYVPDAKAENDVWLCPDGSITTKLKRSGLLKNQAADYKGTKKGTWATSSIGQTGKLILTYDKLPVLEVDLKMEDDRVFLNGKRHFAMRATVCN